MLAVDQPVLPAPVQAASSADDELCVLIVDDEVWIAEELSFGLEEAGLRVQIASSTASAQALIETDESIGVVVTDIRMPGEDGLSLVRRLLTDRPAGRAIETVVMTGHARLEDAVAAVRAGAFDFVRKPFSLDEMTETVLGAMRRAEAKRQEAARRRKAAEVEREAIRMTDPVTGLPNRAAFSVRLAQLQGTPAGARAAVVMIDFDRFISFSEAFGTAAGDTILIETARRLQHVCGSNWIVARTGVDEFAALHAAGISPSEAWAAAERMRAAVETPIALPHGTARLTASLGIAHAMTARTTPLDNAATVAAGMARRSGGARLVAFEPVMQEAAERRTTIGQCLRTAIAREEIALHYQPIFRASDRCLLGFEALLRWRHPALGPVSPGEFIPIAEEGPEILELGAWAIRSAARQAAAWRPAVDRGLYLSVNISGRQIADVDVPELFRSTLLAEHLPPTALVAEVTESVALSSCAAGQLQRLRDFGMRVSLDDFGAGYSSLGMLNDLALDTVKLDRTLISGVTTTPRQRQLFTGLASTIHALGLKMIVEGVETEEQLQVVSETGSEGAQGFLLGRPLTAEMAGRLVTPPC